MVVYADILVSFNTVLTYLIILAAAKFSGIKIKIARTIIASVIGGFTSLYIYLPQQTLIIETLLKIVFSAVITVTFCFKAQFKAILRFFISFYVVSFIYAGFMMAFWLLFKPNGMAINNGIVYFSISPIILIVSTSAIYVIITAAFRLLKREDRFAYKTTVSVHINDKTFQCRCMVDTGNSLNDNLGNGKVIIMSYSMSKRIFGEKEVINLLNNAPDEIYKTKIRLLPYKTLSSNGLIPAIRVSEVWAEKKQIINVLIAISKNDFDGEVDGIISPDFLL